MSKSGLSNWLAYHCWYFICFLLWRGHKRRTDSIISDGLYDRNGTAGIFLLVSVLEETRADGSALLYRRGLFYHVPVCHADRKYKHGIQLHSADAFFSGAVPPAKSDPVYRDRIFYCQYHIDPAQVRGWGNGAL